MVIQKQVLVKTDSTRNLDGGSGVSDDLLLLKTVLFGFGIAVSRTLVKQFVYTC